MCSLCIMPPAKGIKRKIRWRDATRAELGFSGSSIGFPMGLSLTPLAHVSASPQVLPFAAGRKMFPQKRRQPLTNSPEAYALFLFSIAFFP